MKKQNLLFLFRPFLNECHVVRHHVLAQQAYQASLESLDAREQLVLRDHLVVVDPKDPWVCEGAREMKAPEDLKGLQVPEELMGCQ